jgi:hypothetical protein
LLVVVTTHREGIHSGGMVRHRISRVFTAAVGAAFGALVTMALTRPNASEAIHRSLRAATPGRAQPRAADKQEWAALRPTACDGAAHGGVRTVIPRSASIGNFSGTPVQLLRTLSERKGLAYLANDLNLTGNAVELGTWRGEFAELNMHVWRGRMYYMVDLWTSADTDCVNGNASHCVYGGNESRSFDKMITRLRMERGGPKWKGRYTMLQNSTLEAATLFADGYFDWIYLDATHTYAEAKKDLEAWYPKVRVGGLVSGHDYQFQHQKIGDGYVFGVRDAVDEFAAARRLRVYSTMESYLPSFYFLKCTLG